MEIIDAYERKLGNSTFRTPWLQAAILGLNGKMKEVSNLLEDNDWFNTRNVEVYKSRKEAVTKIVKELFTSYCSLAQDYDHHLTATKHKNNNNTGSEPGSIVEHSDIDELEEDNGDNNDDQNSIASSNDINNNKQDKVVGMGGNSVKLQFTKLVEANEELQLELVRRNNDKRETIRKLEEEVIRLTAEKDALKRHLSYIERRRPNNLSNSSGRSVLDRLFRCSF